MPEKDAALETQQTPPIIVKKIKKGHGGAHSSAWKVAFADFISALMALFLVLWLTNAKQEVKEAIGAYFRDPGVFDSTSSSGAMLVGKGSGGPKLVGGGGEDRPGEQEKEAKRLNEIIFQRIRQNLQYAIDSIPELEKLRDQISITATAEGVRIELIDKEHSSFFEPGSANLKKKALPILKAIVDKVGALPYPLIVEGHTDSQPLHSSRENYSNWELSTDRANSARRTLVALGLKRDRIVQVRGYADKGLRYPDHPDDPRNRRISIVLAAHVPDVLQVHQPVIKNLLTIPPKGADKNK